MRVVERTERVQSAVAAVVWAVAVLTLDLVTPRGVAVPVLYVGAVLVTLWSSSRHDTLLAAATGTLLTVVGYVLSHQEGIVWMAVFNRALAVLAVWATALLILRYKGQRKILRGFLPICASCKKIRAGQDLWKELEEYIEEHSEAVFSHGMCLDCFKTWYPEQYHNLLASDLDLLRHEPRNGS